MADSPKTLTSLWAEARAYFENNIEYARLTAAEKIAVLLTSMAVAAVLGVLGCLIFFFLSMAVIYWLATVMPTALAYALMGALYVVAFILIFVFRKQWLINPIARFVSKVILR